MLLAHAGAVVLSGIFAALSSGCADATLAAASIAAAGGGAVLHDPNFRPRLTTRLRRVPLWRKSPRIAQS